MEIGLLIILTLLASCIGTITWFGLSTIMIPLVIFFMPPVEAIFLVAIVHWFGDLWKVLLFREGRSTRLIVLFGGIGIIVGYCGARLSLDIPLDPMLRLLGGFLLLYAVFLFWMPHFRVPATTTSALVGGSISWFCAGVFGIWGPLRALFLNAFGLPKSVYIATAGAIGIVVDSVRIITYAMDGVTLTTVHRRSLLLLIPTSFAGARFAKRMVNNIPQQTFRLIVVTFLGIIGVKLLFF